MSLTKNFEPNQVEEKWYEHWLAKRYFNSTPDDRTPFTVVIPPPNVTGVLHLGHTLNETVQDILVRKARMNGFNTCWVPGSDHASIATEAKVVQMLEIEKGIKKTDIGRDEFLKYAYEWKDKYGELIYYQIKKLGCSVDWDRVSFTMDEHYYKAVIKVFVDLYHERLIYRGARMINWDPKAKTALSDEEVEFREVQGKLYYVKYKVVDEHDNEVFVPNSLHGMDGSLCIATQRPETIMGDTAVCVNPNDERYLNLKRKFAIVPLVNRKVPIIFDEYVDMEFGTGALKITPAHDIHDYNLGLKFNLPVIDTLNEDGTLNEAAEVFVGLDRSEARKRVVEKLKQDDLLVKEEDYSTRLGFSQRTHAVVEPRISTQWFVRMKPLAGKALNAVLSGEIKIHPEERFLATYKYWLENVEDWCISRQLWWGQRIPAWYDDDGNVYVDESEEKAAASYELRVLSSELKAQSSKLRQDEDVLDTWFSSWLWPLEVFKGITNPGNKDIRYYYPTSVLVTGQDIIFFWVARMIMAGMKYKNEKPFNHVYFTGMVRDKQGRKMSKSLGNSPDLLELIDRFGADAVRFGIMIASPAGNDLLFDETSLEQGRNFNNKLWNALKLVRSWGARVRSQESGVGSQESGVGSRELGVGSQESKTHHSPLTTHHFPVQWLENRLNEARTQIEEQYKNFRLSEALKTIYSLIWDDFCSWYLEWIKPGLEEPVNIDVYIKTIKYFEQLVQLLHPFMPFVTEEIYHQLNQRKDGEDLVIKQFEPLSVPGQNILNQGELLKQVITAIRDARNKNRIKPKQTIKLYIQADSIVKYKPIETILAKQLNCEFIQYTNKSIAQIIPVLVQKDKFYIVSENITDTSLQKEQLLKDLDYLKGFLQTVDKKLSNNRFVQNAKPEVIEIEKKKKAEAEAKIKAIEESLSVL